jgi:ribosomal protein S18 acetylase RimI-like enzyme
MASIHIEALIPDMAPQACRVLAQAFVTNPLNAAAFGPSQLARNEAFFRVGLAAMKGTKLVATDGSQILGLIHWVHSPACQFSGLEQLRMAPAMVKGVGLGPALRVASWQSSWSKHDPSRPHVHLGPLGVSPEAQGQHLGHRLMEHYCEALDRTGDSGYLETDRPENVNFYRRFGFEVTDEVRVLGIANYLMWRKAKSPTGQETKDGQ